MAKHNMPRCNLYRSRGTLHVRPELLILKTSLGIAENVVGFRDLSERISELEKRRASIINPASDGF